jgi:hypothetical protein
MPQKKSKSKLIAQRPFRTHVHKRILFQLVSFSILALIMFGIVIFDTIDSGLDLLWVFVGGVLGVIIGMLVGRIFNIKWHEDTQKVIIGVDRLSILLIIVYLGVRLGSQKIFGTFIHGEELTIVTYSTLGGIMIGRVFSLRRRVVAILRDKKLY